MISEKMKYFTANSSAIRAMFVEGKRLAEMYGEENVYDYSLGNPYAQPPEIVKEAIFEVLTKQSPNFVHGYTDNCGYEDIREYVAKATNDEFHTHYDSKTVIMTNGAAGALNILFHSLLNPEDEVIAFAPYFGEYNAYVGNYGGRLVVVDAKTDDFQLNLEDFQKKLSKKTAAVIINSPNNPSGAVYSEQTLKKLSEILEQKQAEIGRPIYLVSDEPYRRIVFDNIEVPFVSKFYRNTFVAYSFSKALSLPGERIGYLLVNPDMDGAEEIVSALGVANRISGFVNAPSLFQRILRWCFKLTSDMSLYEVNRDILYKMLTEIGFSVQKPAGTFYMFPKCPIEDDKKFCEMAKQHRLLLVPGSTFGCPGYFRAAFCIPTEKVKASFNSFQKLMEQFGGGQ